MQTFLKLQFVTVLALTSVLAASANNVERDETHPTEVSESCTLNYIWLQDGFMDLDFIPPYPSVPTVYSSFQTPKYPEPEPE
ncbi:hypothetical protein K435DRAFT_782512 [Dendrothele bispora CBS 962.96]|uniref:Uncharacterized protein n=1 Tax=Dendrothele bispora (strain CBS 962.96) TaxID=1314807 RepID=A0A4V4HDL3_DENBC|nr:hypothetical protein K435DRAFT_782512 [Dendrothele bispora CBS 962.96]